MRYADIQAVRYIQYRLSRCWHNQMSFGRCRTKTLRIASNGQSDHQGPRVESGCVLSIQGISSPVFILVKLRQASVLRSHSLTYIILKQEFNKYA